MRKMETMQPKSLQELKAGRESDGIKTAFSKWADVMMPGDAEEPILAPGPRAALFEWLLEIRMRAELAEAKLKPRRTALLYGPPGTGKTTMAHHLSARLGVPLVCVRSESVVESWLGATGRNLGALFDAMEETEGKAVIFFDEVDALGGKRMNDQGASVERANSLNVLLRRIEMFKGICIAATNRLDAIDPALHRRFDMQISIDLPGEVERFAIIARYAAPYDLPDEDIDLISHLCEGASPALLRGLMEGVKRALIIWPKTGRVMDSPVQVFRQVTASVAPPPEFDMDKRPLLWRDPSSVESLAALSWPWKKPEGATP